MKTRGSRDRLALRIFRILRLLQVDHQQADRHADLDRGEADAGRVVHRLEHVGDERLQLVVERLHRLGNLPQDADRASHRCGEWPWSGFSLSAQRVQAIGRRARSAWASVPSSR